MNETPFVLTSIVFCSSLLAPGCEDTAAPEASLAPESAPATNQERPRQGPAPGQRTPAPWGNRLTPDSGFPCEIEKILATSCRRCHWEPREYDAPFSLVKWEATRETRSGKFIFELMRKQVAADLMPPVLEVVAEPPVEALRSEDKKTLLEWLEAGAEKSNDTCVQP